MAVAVQRQQATQPVHKYAQQQQVQQAQAIFTQSLMKCYDAFLHAQKTSGAFGPSFIDTFQTQDISLILLALTFSSANNPVLYTKACLDALYYQPADQEYPALAKTLPLLIQSFCDSSGKFTFKNNNLT